MSSDMKPTSFASKLDNIACFAGQAILCQNINLPIYTISAYGLKCLMPGKYQSVKSPKLIQLCIALLQALHLL